MKILRFFTIVLIAVLLISTWSPAYAQANDVNIGLAKAKLASVRVNNMTGGTLYVYFSGPSGRSLSTSQQGKTTFSSVLGPGKYRVTVSASACPGILTFTRTVKEGTVVLPAFYCRHR